jgi:hypothetical protein
VNIECICCVAGNGDLGRRLFIPAYIFFSIGNKFSLPSGAAALVEAKEYDGVFFRQLSVLLERFPLHIEGSVINRSIGARDSGINTTG